MSSSSSTSTGKRPLLFYSEKSKKNYKIISNIEEDFNGKLFFTENGIDYTVWEGLIDVDKTGTNPPTPDANKPPVVRAGDDLVVKENTLVTIDGSAADVDGPIVICEWHQTAGPMMSVTEDENDPTNFSFTTPTVAEGEQTTVLEFTLTATDMEGAESKDSCTITVTKTGEPNPPTPLPPDDKVLYDSNRDGHWDNGKARVVKGKEGDTKANGKGLYTAASGSPEFHIDGKGVGELHSGRYGRIYICVNNYNSSLEYEFMIKSDTVRNLSDKIRNRHQMGGDCANKPGLFGSALSLTEVDFKTESCHNNHENSISKPLKQKLKLNTWYKSRFTVKDADDKKSVNFIRELDYNDGKGWQVVATGKHSSPKPAYMNKDLFMNQSEVWLRNNNTAQGVTAYKNVRVIEVT